MKEHYNPKGYDFYDNASQQEMKLVTEGPYKDWICFKHPDGQWVTLRKASDEDRAALAKAISVAHHQD